MKILKIVIFAFLISFTSCKSYHNFYDYYYNSNYTKASNRVIVTDLNLVFKTKNTYLKNKFGFKNDLISYLEKNNYEIVSNSKWNIVFEQEIKKIGGLYDSVTGEFISSNYFQAIESTISKLNKTEVFDIVIISDIVVSSAELHGHNVGWNGVDREIEVDGARPNNYDNHRFNGQTSALSYRALVYDRNGTQILLNFGGIEHCYMYNFDNVRKTTVHQYEKHEYLLNGNYNEGAIEIALHPLIPSSNGKK